MHTHTGGERLGNKILSKGNTGGTRIKSDRTDFRTQETKKLVYTDKGVSSSRRYDYEP